MKSIYNIIFPWIIINSLLYFFGYKSFLLGSLVRLFSFLQSLSDILSWDPRRFFPYFSNANDFSREVFVPGYLRMLFFSPYNAAKYITETKTHYYYWNSLLKEFNPVVCSNLLSHWDCLFSLIFFSFKYCISFFLPLRFTLFYYFTICVWGVI